MTRFEEQADHFAIVSDDGGQRAAYPVRKEQPDARGEIGTTHGMLPVADLVRTVLFEDRQSEWVVVVEWRRGAELVRRDVNVVLKQGSVIADAIASQV